MFQFSQKSYRKLTGVHPDLVACVVACLYRYTPVDFAVIEGVRDVETQKLLVKNGKSWTMNSRHLVQEDGWGYAVDLAPWVRGAIPWDEWRYFEEISNAMYMAARYLRINITWGGDWKVKDGPHFQLER